MSDSEMRELDFFCAEHVLKSARVQKQSPRRWAAVYQLDKFPEGIVCGGAKSEADAWDFLWYQIKHPTTDPAAAMEVQLKCLNAIKGISELNISETDEGFFIDCELDERPGVCASGETFSITICKFAKALFSK